MRAWFPHTGLSPRQVCGVPRATAGRLFASSDSNEQFFAKTCQHFCHTFPKALPQTSAGCSVLGIIRGYKLRTCPSDRAIGAQPKGATKLRFSFLSACFFEVFFLPTAAGPCGAEYKHTVHSASAAPTWRTAPGPWGPNERRPQMQAAPGRAESPETASERPVYRVECPQLRLCRIAQMSESPNVRNRPTC